MGISVQRPLKIGRILTPPPERGRSPPAAALPSQGSSIGSKRLVCALVAADSERPRAGLGAGGPRPQPRRSVEVVWSIPKHSTSYAAADRAFAARSGFGHAGGTSPRSGGGGFMRPMKIFARS
jgi:hypothetical protein